jgi:hypothetical protein
MWCSSVYSAHIKEEGREWKEKKEGQSGVRLILGHLESIVVPRRVVHDILREACQAPQLQRAIQMTRLLMNRSRSK